MKVDIKRLEEDLRENVDEKTVVLVVASYLGGQAILEKKELAKKEQEIKKDGSTVGELDFVSGKAIAKYVNKVHLKDIAFSSEENMEFKAVQNPKYWGLFDDLDGSINPLIGGKNYQFVGVGGVIHKPEKDEQIAAVIYLPFRNQDVIFLAEKDRGTFRFNVTTFELTRIELTKRKAKINCVLENSWMHKNTLAAEQALHEQGFYKELGIGPRDRITAGMATTISALLDHRQVLVNYAPSHQADCCWLLLEEAGAEVIGVNGEPMHSTSPAMLAIMPSFSGDSTALKEKFVKALKGYQGWNPGEVMKRVCQKN